MIVAVFGLAEFLFFLNFAFAFCSYSSLNVLVLLLNILHTHNSHSPTIVFTAFMFKTFLHYSFKQKHLVLMPKHLTKEKKRNTKYNTYLKGKMFAILSRSFAHFVLHLRISIHTHNKCTIYNANSVQCDIISKMQNAYISIVSNASIFLWFLYGCIYLYVDVH